jgi:hypothetical protein
MFEIEWTRSRLAWQQRAHLAPFCQEAILLEKVWLGGQPRTKVISRIARVVEDRINDPAEQERFWSAARAKLGTLRGLGQRDRWQIELQLRKKVPLPISSPTPTARPSANPVAGA